MKELNIIVNRTDVDDVHKLLGEMNLSGFNKIMIEIEDAEKVNELENNEIKYDYVELLNLTSLSEIAKEDIISIIEAYKEELIKDDNLLLTLLSSNIMRYYEDVFNRIDIAEEKINLINPFILIHRNKISNKLYEDMQNDSLTFDKIKETVIETDNIFKHVNEMYKYRSIEFKLLDIM